MRRLNNIFLALVGGWAGLALSAVRAETARPIDSYAALVNSRVVTAGEVLSVLQPLEQQLRTLHEGRELEDKLNDAYQQTLNTLIERALILEEFKAMGGALPERAVEDYVNSVIHDRFNDDRATFLSALADERLTLADWREEMKDRLIVSIMRRQEINDRILLAPSQIRRAYEQRIDSFKQPAKVQLRMIVIHQGETEADRQAKREQADKIRARLEAGEDFAAVAKENSEGAKAAQGGDLGWLDPGSLRPEIARAVEEIKPLEVTPVVAAGEDYYILKLEARKKASVTPFEQARVELEEDLRETEGRRLYDAWIARLKRKHFVRVFPPIP